MRRGATWSLAVALVVLAVIVSAYLATLRSLRGQAVSALSTASAASLAVHRTWVEGERTRASRWVGSGTFNALLVSPEGLREQLLNDWLSEWSEAARPQRVWVFDYDGKLLAGTDRSPLGRLTETSTPGYAVVATSEGCTQLIRTRVEGPGGFVMAMVLFDLGAVRGLQDNFRVGDVGETGHTFAVGPGGRVLSDSQVGLRGRGRRSMAIESVTQHAEGENVWGYTDHLGRDVVGTWVWIEDWGFGVVSEQSVQEVLATSVPANLGFAAVAFAMLVLTGALFRLDRANDAARGALESSRREAEAEATAKARFLAVMSHELRTPLHGILGTAEMLALSENLDADDREMVGTVRASGAHLVALIDDILDLSKAEADAVELNLQAFAPGQVFEFAFDTFDAKARTRNLRIERAWSTDIPVVVGDRIRIQQVLFNLLGNGLKFTEQGGVRLGCEWRETPEGIALRFSVRDSGSGIPPERQAFIFQPFRQADATTQEVYGGTGLGLAISKRLVETMGGTIEVESTVGVGSEFAFQVVLPRGQLAERASGARVGADGFDGRSLRVLVVDDNRLNLRLAERMLQSLGATVTCLENGQEAVDWLARQTTDLVLMDGQMPVMDGFEATRQICSTARRPPPVVALTADAQASTRDRALEAGMVEVLTKPLSRDQLAQALSNWSTGPQGPRRK